MFKSTANTICCIKLTFGVRWWIVFQLHLCAVWIMQQIHLNCWNIYLHLRRVYLINVAKKCLSKNANCDGRRRDDLNHKSKFRWHSTFRISSHVMTSKVHNFYCFPHKVYILPFSQHFCNVCLMLIIIFLYACLLL